MIIYKLTNTINGKCYIGQTKHKTIANRMKDHRSGTKTSMPIAKAIQEFGEKAFKKEILCRVSTPDILDTLEKIYIEIFESLNPDKGYNARPIGSISDYAKKKISEAQTGNKNCEGRNIPLLKLRKPVLCSNGQTYPSVKAAAQALGVNSKNISSVANGRLKRAGGYTFTFIEKV